MDVAAGESRSERGRRHGVFPNLPNSDQLNYMMNIIEACLLMMIVILFVKAVTNAATRAHS
jgi:hypothetical protein